MLVPAAALVLTCCLSTPACLIGNVVCHACTLSVCALCCRQLLARLHPDKARYHHVLEDVRETLYHIVHEAKEAVSSDMWMSMFN